MASLKQLLNLGKTNLSEGCKKKKKTKKIVETTDLNIEALSTILEMVKSNSLTSDEIKLLASTIEYTFTSIMESDEEDYEEEESSYTCTECEWSGLESDLDEDGNCPECGSTVAEESECECEDCGWTGLESDLDEDGNCPECGGIVSEISYDDDEMYESNMLNKTPPDVKRAAKSYARSAKGKKAVKNANKKRAKFAAKIDSCAEKGKTFSFKEMTCVKPKKRR